MHRGRTDEYIFTGTGHFLRRTFRIDSERTLAGPPSSETGRGTVASRLFAGGPDRIRADRLGLRAGPPRSGGSLLATHGVAPSGAAAAGSGLSAAARRLPARTHPDHRQASHAGSHQALGRCPPIGQRHAGRRAAVWDIPGLGGRGPHLVETPRAAAGSRRAALQDE